MSNPRISKKVHSRFLAEFCVEASQDKAWCEALSKLAVGESISTSEKSWPEDFEELFEEVNLDALTYGVTRVALDEVPREASAWWPADAKAHYFKFSPKDFPQTKLYMMIDCFEESDSCCH